MADDPNRKKSLREEVEEYKRLQREAEAASTAAADDEDDADLDDESADEIADLPDVDFKAATAEAEASGKKVVKIVSTVFVMVGIVLLLVSAALFFITRRSVAAEVSVEGLVVKNVVRAHTTRAANSTRDTTSDYYHAVVEFPLADGTKKTVEMSEGHWPKAHDEGEKVIVRYDPTQPLRARIGGGSAMDFFASLLTGFLGAVFTAIAIGIRRAFPAA